MRKITLFLLFVLLLASCQQMELEFSCDPIINEFVLENQEEFSSLTLSEFLVYDLTLQKAIYNSWDPWKKRDVWIDKLEKIIEGGEFTSEEIEYIQKLIDHIDSDYFLSENLATDNDTRSLFAQQWMDDTRDNLGWTDKTIAFLVYRLYTDAYQFENELSRINQLEESVTSSSESCNCNSKSDYCGDWSCTTSDCAVVSGCGWLWSMDCNGLCLMN